MSKQPAVLIGRASGAGAAPLRAKGWFVVTLLLSVGALLVHRASTPRTPKDRLVTTERSRSSSGDLQAAHPSSEHREPSAAAPAPERRSTSTPPVPLPTFQVDPGDDEEEALASAQATAAEQHDMLRARAETTFQSSPPAFDRTREVHAELRARLGAAGIDERRLEEVECRGNLCRAEARMPQSELVRFGMAARQSKLRVQVVDIQPHEKADSRIIAFLEEAPSEKEPP